MSGTGYQPHMFSDPFSGQSMIYWYAPGSGGDTMWRLTIGPTGVSASDSFAVPISETYRVGNCQSNLLLHGPGSQPDKNLTVNGSTATLTEFSISGSFRVSSTRGTWLCTTIWHAPGPAMDLIWLQVVDEP